MSEGILAQLDELSCEVEDIRKVIEKSETFRKFGEWINEHHSESNIVCEINRYRDLMSIDPEGTIIKADNLLQIRYIDSGKGKIKNK
jgi:hypothetical protein